MALADLLEEASQGHNMSGLALHYSGRMLEAGAQIILKLGEVGSVDVPFTSRSDYRSTVQEAVWWMPCRAQAIIVLGNASEAPIRVRVQDTEGEEGVRLNPYTSRILHRSGHCPPRPRQAQSGPFGSRQRVRWGACVLGASSPPKRIFSQVRFDSTTWEGFVSRTFSPWAFG